MKILIIGASGSGTTTLGKALAGQIDYKHLDVDDYYWKSSEPSFLEKVPFAERNTKLLADYHYFENIVMSGSLVSWGRLWENAFDLAVFLYLPPLIRMERLKQREIQRYGNRLKIDQDISKQSRAFLDWAAHYDDPTFTGRSLVVHQEWLEKLSCPVLRIEGEIELAEKLESILTKVESL